VTRFGQVLNRLGSEQVEFILVGRTPENLHRLVSAPGTLRPYLRGVPPGLAFRFDYEPLRAGLNFTLTTSLGSVDLLGEIAGGGGYDDLLTRWRWRCSL
jgi:hypothetical protein